MGNEANTMTKKLTTGWDDQKGLLKRFYKRHGKVFKFLGHIDGQGMGQRSKIVSRGYSILDLENCNETT